MRIIQSGNPREVQVNCKKCNAIFAFTESDLKEEDEMEWNRNMTIKYSITYYTVRCPCCNQVYRFNDNPFE